MGVSGNHLPSVCFTWGSPATLFIYAHLADFTFRLLLLKWLPRHSKVLNMHIFNYKDIKTIHWLREVGGAKRQTAAVVLFVVEIM